MLSELNLQVNSGEDSSCTTRKMAPKPTGGIKGILKKNTASKYVIEILGL